MVGAPDDRVREDWADAVHTVSRMAIPATAILLRTGFRIKVFRKAKLPGIMGFFFYPFSYKRNVTNDNAYLSARYYPTLMCEYF